MIVEPGFVFCTCQVGAEIALKAELSRLAPGLRLSYSRPGFVTLKRTSSSPLAAEALDASAFARAWAQSLGAVRRLDEATSISAIWKLACDRKWRRLHVWERDRSRPGFGGIEPGPTEAARQLRESILAAAPPGFRPAQNEVARPGDAVLDVVIVSPQEFWVGWHVARRGESCLPGGLRQLSLPPGAISRAWLKMEEALLWSSLHIKRGDGVVELGCAPGGSCQALLGRGMRVLGVDPALVHEDLRASPRFTHIRMRAAEVRKSELKEARWLVADMNLVPDSTLAAVEDIVTNRHVRLHGLIMMLKLVDWESAANLPQWISRVEGWGFAYVKARQLQFNRQEICLAAWNPPAATTRTSISKPADSIQRRGRHTVRRRIEPGS